MNYQPLSKLFYSDKNYNNIFNLRFNSENTIHLDFDIKDNNAFFMITPYIFDKTIDIYKTDKIILKLCNKLPDVALEQITFRSLVDEIILSNDIEGISSTRKEVFSVLNELENKSIENKANKNRLDGLVNKYVLLKSNKTLQFSSCDDIRQLYNELVFEEIKKDNPENLPDGKIFRKESTSVVTATQKEIHRGVYPESKIIECMEKALKILNDNSLQTIFRIAIFHYLFGYIHPFYDGNGRTSRFISSYLLSKEFEPIIAYRLSYTIKENIISYYNAFKICNDKNNKGDLTPFVEMFVNIINISMKQLEKSLETKIEKLKFYENKIFILPNGTNKKYRNLYFLLIQASLFSENGIHTKDLLEMENVSRNTLNSRLDLVDENNLLISNRFGNTLYYMLDLEKFDDIIKEQFKLK